MSCSSPPFWSCFLHSVSPYEGPKIGMEDSSAFTCCLRSNIQGLIALACLTKPAGEAKSNLVNSSEGSASHSISANISGYPCKKPSQPTIIIKSVASQENQTPPLLCWQRWPAMEKNGSRYLNSATGSFSSKQWRKLSTRHRSCRSIKDLSSSEQSLAASYIFSRTPVSRFSQPAKSLIGIIGQSGLSPMFWTSSRAATAFKVPELVARVAARSAPLPGQVGDISGQHGID
nr:hypothetical protein Iba_chr14bCG6660 [Ipomoea batatas]